MTASKFIAEPALGYNDVNNGGTLRGLSALWGQEVQLAKQSAALKANFPKSKLRRELILDAAQELLLSEGYSAITGTKVAKKAGIVPSHLHYYFPTVNDLVLEMHKVYRDMYMSKIEDGAFRYINEESPERVLERLFDTHMNMIKEHQHDVIIWETQAWGSRNPTVKAYHEEWVDWYTKNVAKIIRLMNPKMSRHRSYRLAAIISVLMDNMQRFLGESKPHPSKFRGLEKEIKSIFDLAIKQDN